MPGLVEQPSYYIENTELIILPGKEGLKLLQDETKQLIIETIDNASSFNIELPVITVSPDKIDIQKSQAQWKEVEKRFKGEIACAVSSVFTSSAIAVIEPVNSIPNANAKPNNFFFISTPPFTVHCS